MIKWIIFYSNNNDSWEEKDISAPITLSLGESFNVKFRVDVYGESIKFGSPTIIINEIPILMEADTPDLKQNLISYKSIFENSYSSKPFLNYFGESIIYLNFDKNYNYKKVISVNILARLENAKIAEEMLSFLNNRYYGIISLCFSRSSIRGNYSSYREPDISIKNPENPENH